MKGAGTSRRVCPASSVGDYLQAAGMMAEIIFQMEMKRTQIEKGVRKVVKKGEALEDDEAGDGC